ncbi:hypothetical protein [Sphingobacterium multivorum]|uniref:hypothetical protein n=1 Tax=Sphingobacterium TaxID=28453 RepID=UPI00289B620D|nr:hypothetical protein [Sphingobacterium multivorum]
MPILVRRISRSKWESYDYVNSDNPPADAITNCLRTHDNELSTWKIDNLDELEKAILCLITGSKQENLSTIHIVYFDINLIGEHGLSIKESIGDTVISEYNNSHFDVTSLDYQSLGSFKNLILSCLRSGNVKTITRGELKKILNKAKDDRILDESLLNPTYQSNL